MDTILLAVCALASVNADSQVHVLVQRGVDHSAGQHQNLMKKIFSTMQGHTHVVQHEIKTLPGVMVQATEDEVAKMLQDGIMKEFASPGSSPIVIVSGYT